MLKPAPLRQGNVVRVVAPSGPFDRESFDAGVTYLRARYDVRFDDTIFARARYLAGPDALRHATLVAALSDPDAKAVFCARGGYGAMRLLPHVAPANFPPKWLVGFSDITALHAVWQRAGRISVHGPVVTQLSRAPADAREQLFRVLESDAPPETLTGLALEPGIAEGPLIGGNLSVLTRLLGTPYAPPFDGAVLLLEDVGERPYRLDRMWTHLALAGVFAQVKGIVLGQFTGCDEGDLKALDVLTHLAHETRLPCAVGFPIGHEDRNFAVPLGARVRLDAAKGTLQFLGEAVA